MKAVWFGPGDLAWVEPETDNEELFLKDCPTEWSWTQAWEAWEKVKGLNGYDRRIDLVDGRVN